MLRSTKPTLNRFALVLLLGATVLTSACVDDDVIEVGDSGEVTVMTRNLYLGADIFRLTAAEPQQIPVVVAQLFGTAQVNNFGARAGALAAEIEAVGPDLIGLQEVTMYRVQDPSDYITGTTTPNAEFVFIDYLDVLMDSLAARGLDYSVAASVENADVELPAARSATEFFDVRLTDRDVILARSNVQVGAAGTGQFNTLAPLPVGGQVMQFPRGYAWAQVTVDNVSFMFVNSHLEVSAGGLLQPVQAAQAYELTSGFGRMSPIVMVGDFNSAPGAPPYNILNASWEDAWSAVGSGDGPTCCQPEVLLQTGTFGERIDLVLYRGAIDALSVQVLGNEQADRTSGGLWPSDHAGVAATLQIHE